MARTGAARQGKAETAGAALLHRQRALSAVADAASVEAARAVAHAAAVAWWQASAKAHGPGRPAPVTTPAALALAELSPFTVADARAFGRDLARLPLSEAVAALGRLYTRALPPAHRTQYGILYAPPALIRRMLDKAEAAGHDWRSRWRTGRSPAAGVEAST